MEKIINLAPVLLLAPFLAGQQATTSQTISPPQAQAAPCPTLQPQPSKLKNTYLDRLKKTINDQGAKAATRTGVPMPTSDDLTNMADASGAPCPPAATSTKPSALAIPVLHLPTGVITTWLCNPIVTSTDPSHTVTFITPDALTSAEPTQASAFEADGAKADPKAAVSCANLRRDPKNNKVFLAQ